MAFKIQDIKTALEFGGARPSLFRVELDLPLAISGGQILPQGGSQAADKTTFKNKLSFLCNAASLPSSTIAPIEVSYFGRKIKVAGNRTFPEWTLTIINDEDFALRNAFESWMGAINGHTTNLRNSGATSTPDTYKVDGKVLQFGKADDQSPIRKYQFQGLFPTEVSAIETNWATENEIESFTVTLQYDLWVLDASKE